MDKVKQYEESLSAKLPEILRAQYQSLTFVDGVSIPFRSYEEDQKFKREIEARLMDFSGQFQAVGAGSNDWKRLASMGRSVKGNVQVYGASVSYSDGEIEQAKENGVDMVVEFVRATREAAYQKLNGLLAYGDEAFGIEGFVNSKSISDVSSKLVLSPWSDLDGVDREDLLTSLINQVLRQTKSRVANTVLLSTHIYTDIKAYQGGTDYSGRTIFERIQSKFSDVEGFLLKWSPELDGAGTGGKDVVMAYNRGSDVVEAQMVMPLEFSKIEEVNGGWEYKQYARMATGGVWIKQPKAVAKIEMTL